MKLADVAARPAHCAAVGVASTAAAILHDQSFRDAVVAVLSLSRVAALCGAMPAPAVFLGCGFNGVYNVALVCGGGPGVLGPPCGLAAQLSERPAKPPVHPPPAAP